MTTGKIKACMKVRRPSQSKARTVRFREVKLPNVTGGIAPRVEVFKGSKWSVRCSSFGTEERNVTSLPKSKSSALSFHNSMKITKEYTFQVPTSGYLRLHRSPGSDVGRLHLFA